MRGLPVNWKNRAGWNILPVFKMKNILSSLLLLLVLAGCKSQPSSQPSTNSSASTAEAAAPAVAPAATPDLANAGSIKGVVDFKGAVPRVPTIDMTADPMCPQTPRPAETAVVKNGKLANVFVYVKEGAPAGPYPVPSTPVVLDQKNCRYSPHMMGIMAKQPFKITNTDQADHNIHDMPSKIPPGMKLRCPRINRS